MRQQLYVFSYMERTDLFLVAVFARRLFVSCVCVLCLYVCVRVFARVYVCVCVFVREFVFAVVFLVHRSSLSISGLQAYHQSYRNSLTSETCPFP